MMYLHVQCCEGIAVHAASPQSGLKDHVHAVTVAKQSPTSAMAAGHEALMGMHGALHVPCPPLPF